MSSRALVVGGSLGGLLVANMLHRAGWDVLVLERAGETLSGRGAGIVTHPELFECLEAAGIEIDDTIGVWVPGRVTLGLDGKPILERDLPQILTAWGRLYHLLKAALPTHLYRFGAGLQTVEQDEHGVTAILADGTREHGIILIGADGFRSTVRQHLLPEVRPVYAGYIAWRGLTEEADLSPETHRAIFERFAFCLPPGEQMLGYPVAGRADDLSTGKRRFNFVWYRPAAEATELADLLTDGQGRSHADGIPPALIRPEIRAAMLRDADTVLAPQFAEVVRKAQQPFFQQIFDLESPRLAFGRVALVGDAAFVARPHCGMGVTKAAGDALALTKALQQSKSIQQALQSYENTRLSIGKFIVSHARHLGAYMQAQLQTPEERLMAERYRSTEAVMAETAISPTLPA